MDPTSYNIRAYYSNKTGQHLSGLNMQVAVQKYMKLSINPLTSTDLPAFSSGSVMQDMRIQNTLDGQKPMAVKIRVIYTIAATGQQISETKVINALPT